VICEQVPVSAPTASVDEAPSRPAQAYGRMLSPIYARKLQAIDFDFQNSVSRTTQRDRYPKESEIVISVKWWNEVSIFTSLGRELMVESWLNI
jgi:hypothetical protein